MKITFYAGKAYLARLLPLTIFLFLVYSCKQQGDEAPPDVSNIRINLQTRRFDQDLSRIDTTQIAAGLQQLSAKYPDFLSFYLDQLLNLNIRGQYSESVPGVHEGMHTYLTNKDFRGLFDTVARHFPDTKSIDESLRKGFQYMTYYHPGYTAPKVVYFVSFLNNWSVITVDTDVVGVGLDMFLGPQYPFYKSVGIPDYMAEGLKPAAVPVNAFKAIYEAKQPFDAQNHNLLDLMIERGKEQYFLSKIIPFVPDSTRLGFTADQTDWCRQNEGSIYGFFVKENMLYETNWQKMLRYVNEGPTAAGMPPQSPGNVGTFLGWQIIRAYVSRHPGIKMDDLFAIKDAQKILQEANYKPK